MHTAVALLAILGALLVGVVSPGPSFVMVAHTSIALSQRNGVAAALGMGVGGVLFGALALIGLQALLAQVGWLYLVLKLLGGAYLLVLAAKLWRGAAQPVVVPKTAGTRPASPWRSFAFGLATQLSNPKTAIIYGSVFAALLPAAPPLWVLGALPPLIFLLEAGWYTIVAVAFSADRSRTAYLRSKTWIDRIVGAVMGGLGLRLLAETVVR